MNDGYKSYTSESETETCPDCGRPIIHGHIEAMGNTYETILECPCVTARKEQERAKLIAAGRVRAREYRGISSGLSKRNRLQYFRNYHPEDGQQKAFEAAREFAKAYIEGKNDGTGLLLIGGVGSGKTHLAAAIINAILDYIPVPDSEAEESAMYSDQSGGRYYGIRFVCTVALLEEIRSSYDKDEDTQEIVQRYKTAKLLVLDDLGAERPSEWVRERLFDIIDYRYNECLPVIITSNANLQELRQHLGDRLCDRIRSICQTYTVAAKSHRPTGDTRQIPPSHGTDFDVPPDVDMTPPSEEDVLIDRHDGDTLADVLRRADDVIEEDRNRKKSLYERMRE